MDIQAHQMVQRGLGFGIFFFVFSLPFFHTAVRFRSPYWAILLTITLMFGIDTVIFVWFVLQHPLTACVPWGVAVTLSAVLPLHLLIRSRERFVAFVRQPPRPGRRQD